MDDRQQTLKTALYGTEGEAAVALRQLAESPGDGDPIRQVAEALACARDGRPTGLVVEDHFELPHLAARYPDELLSFLVPESYSPARPVALLVLMHGGGMGTGRDVAKTWLLPGQEGSSYHFGEELARLDCIAVAPSNLLLDTHKRWSTPESDAYLLAVIEEAAYRYAIDPDRVAVAGQSMGGFGAYHVVQTMGDRFSVVGCHAGAWVYGFWEGLRGVNLYAMHGVHDAAKDVRPRFTDVAYSRFAHAILSGLHLPHVYREHDGGHTLGDPAGRALFREFLERAPAYVRDPFPTTVCTASRKGAFELAPTPHFFWVSLATNHHHTCNGTFELDHVETTEEQPSYCTTGFRLRRIACPGGTVQAVNRGENRIELHARNVFAVTLWLHPAMVDFARPVTVAVNGEIRFQDMVLPSVATAAASFRRRRDPGSVCSGRIDLTLKYDDAARVRQGVWETP